MKKIAPANKDININDLKTYDNNSRTHSDGQVNQIVNSIKELGFTSWRFCVENDCYIATRCGVILRVCRRQKSKSGSIISVYKTKVLRGSLDNDGYRTYRMMVDGKRRHMKGHRLVLGAYLGYKCGKVVNHIDGVKLNNSLYNLEWVTVAQNNKHARDNGLWKAAKGNNQKVHPSSYVSIYLMIKLANYSRKDVAIINSVSRQTIDKIFNKIDKVLGHV